MTKLAVLNLKRKNGSSGCGGTSRGPDTWREATEERVGQQEGEARKGPGDSRAHGPKDCSGGTLVSHQTFLSAQICRSGKSLMMLDLSVTQTWQPIKPLRMTQARTCWVYFPADVSGKN